MKTKHQLDIFLNLIIMLPISLIVLLYAFCVFVGMAPFVLAAATIGVAPQKEIGEWFRQKIALIRKGV
jgi:hypothetical protein